MNRCLKRTMAFLMSVLICFGSVYAGGITAYADGTASIRTVHRR